VGVDDGAGGPPTGSGPTGDERVPGPTRGAAADIAAETGAAAGEAGAGAGEAGAGEAGAAEVGVAEVGVAEVGVAEVGVAEVGAAVRVPEAEVGAAVRGVADGTRRPRDSRRDRVAAEDAVTSTVEPDRCPDDPATAASSSPGASDPPPSAGPAPRSPAGDAPTSGTSGPMPAAPAREGARNRSVASSGSGMRKRSVASASPSSPGGSGGPAPRTESTLELIGEPDYGPVTTTLARPDDDGAFLPLDASNAAPLASEDPTPYPSNSALPQ
jgi:hypothetical protein